MDLVIRVYVEPSPFSKLVGKGLDEASAFAFPTLYVLCAESVVRSARGGSLTARDHSSLNERK